MPNPDGDMPPLSEATFYILLCLAPGPAHGYAILKEAAELSGGRVALSTGTLYGALKRLLEQGWIAEAPEANGAAAAGGPPRRAYSLTERGRRALAAESTRLRRMAAAARLRLGEEGI